MTGVAIYRHGSQFTAKYGIFGHCVPPCYFCLRRHAVGCAGCGRRRFLASGAALVRPRSLRRVAIDRPVQDDNGVPDGSLARFFRRRIDHGAMNPHRQRTATVQVQRIGAPQPVHEICQLAVFPARGTPKTGQVRLTTRPAVRRLCLRQLQRFISKAAHVARALGHRHLKPPTCGKMLAVGTICQVGGHGCLTRS